MPKLFLATLFFFLVNDPAWLNNLDKAKELAKQENKLILVNFSGSDWCIPCIRMHEQVFASGDFVKYASDNLILVNIDFPRKNKNQLSKDQQKINDALAERYNPTGIFPYTVLLNKEGNKIKVWDGFYNKGVQNFIDEMKEASRNK